MEREQLITKQFGFSVIEVVLTGSIFALLVTALVGAFLYGEESTALAGNRARAAILAEEGLEAIKNIRDDSWANLVDGTYGLVISGNEWNLSGSSDTTDIFTREVTISTVDDRRKNVTSQITWQQNLQRTGVISIVSELTNWAALGIGNWAVPVQESNVDISGDQDGIKIQVLGNYAYIVRSGGAPDFAVIDVSNPTSPSLVGSLSLPGTPQNIYVLGNYAYIANDSNGQELQIIDISLPSSPNVVGRYNDAGGEDARGVFVSGSFAYLALDGGNDFVIVDVSIPAAPTFVGGLALSDSGYEVVVQGNYAYLSSGSDTEELQIIDITVPTLPTLVGSLNLSGASDATTIALVGTTAFIGQGSLLYTVNVFDPLLPIQLGSLNAVGVVNDIALDLGNGDTYVFIATSDDSLEFQVIDVTVLAAPALLGSLDTAGTDNLNGVAYSGFLDRSFVVGEANSQEFIVIAPQ
jgi:Tfp pilus assembly protein PilV